MTLQSMAGSLDRALGLAWKLEAHRPGFWKVLALCLGASFALWQYYSLQNAATVSRTMEYIKRYEDGRVADSRRSITTKMRPFMPSFDRIKNPSPEDDAKMFHAIEDANPTIVDDIDTIVDFFEGLTTCVNEKICSRNVALGYFGSSESRDLWNNFRTYIVERRQNNRNYASGLEWFVKNSEIR